jgi:cytochrome c556
MRFAPLPTFENRLRRVAAAALALTIGLATVSAVAHQGATGIVKERMDTMSEIARNMKALAAMVKSDRVDPDAAREIGSRVAEQARLFPTQFPEGSLSTVSEARAEIWTKFDDFRSKSDALAKAAVALAETAPDDLDRGALRQALAAMGQTCKSCHESYRVKKN